jgi:hypothetical protein
LGQPLPDSARKHRTWWSNDSTPGRHSSSWLQAGWFVEEVQQSTEMVTFRQTKQVLKPPVGSFTDVAPLWVERLWLFLNQEDAISKMLEASDAGRPAAEAIAVGLYEEFGDDLKSDRLKQFIGFLIRQIMERRGYRHAGKTKKTQENPVFSNAALYIQLNPAAVQIWEGTYYQHNLDTNYLMTLEIEWIRRREFAGRLHWPTLNNSITTIHGQFVQKPDRQKKWSFVTGFEPDAAGTWLKFQETNLLQGKNVVLGEWYYAYAQDVGQMDGVTFRSRWARKPSGEFKLQKLH